MGLILPYIGFYCGRIYKQVIGCLTMAGHIGACHATKLGMATKKLRVFGSIFFEHVMGSCRA